MRRRRFSGRAAEAEPLCLTPRIRIFVHRSIRRCRNYVTTIHYLIGRSKGKAFADRAVGDLLGVFGVAAVDAAVLDRAVSLGFRDFEDGVCAAAAEAAGCELLVTRDVAGFRKSPVPIALPAVVLAGLGPPLARRPVRRRRNRLS